MKNLVIVILNLVFISAYSQSAIPTKKTPSPYSKNGVTIVDDYSWLENIKSQETTKWVEDENKITTTHLEEARKKYNFEKKIKEYNSYQSSRVPEKKRKIFLFRIFQRG